MEDAPEEVTIRITLVHLAIIGLCKSLNFNSFVITKHAENKPESLRTILEEVAGWESTYSVLTNILAYILGIINFSVLTNISASISE